MSGFEDILQDVEQVEERITISRMASGDIQTHIDVVSDRSAFEMLVALIADFAQEFDEDTLTLALRAGIELR